VKNIENRFSVLLKTILIGFLVVLVLVFDKNIERIIIVFLTYLVSSTLRNKRISFIFLRTFFLGLITGLIIGNFFLYIYISNQTDFQGKNYNTGNKRIDKPAVVLLAKGESKNYNPILILKNLYKEKGYINKGIIPYNAFLHKIAYEELGSSIYNDICEKICQLLQENLGYDYDVFMTYLNTNPKLINELEGFSERYDKIILIPLFLYESEEYNKLKEIVNKKLLYSQTKLESTSFLWESEKLAKQIAVKASNIISSNNRSLTGIILFESSSSNNVNEKKHFLNRIIFNLEKYEFESNKIRIMEKINSSKFIKNNVNRLQEMGIGRIIIINCSDIIDDIKNMKEIINIIDKVSKTEGIQIDYISGWGIGEDLLNELEYQTRIVNLTD